MPTHLGLWGEQQGLAEGLLLPNPSLLQASSWALEIVHLLLVLAALGLQLCLQQPAPEEGGQDDRQGWSLCPQSDTRREQPSRDTVAAAIA